jgi:DNA-binding NtrC family response regulator
MSAMALDSVPAKNPGFGSNLIAADAENAAAPQKRTQPLKVLVVDDEPLIRWSVRRGLTKRGHEVYEAASAAETLAKIAAEGPFHAIVLDYRLPDRRDLSLLREVVEANHGGTVVMITAFGEPEMRDDARALGARTVIEKPFQVADLIRLIETV